MLASSASSRALSSLSCSSSSSSSSARQSPAAAAPPLCRRRPSSSSTPLLASRPVRRRQNIEARSSPRAASLVVRASRRDEEDEEDDVPMKPTKTRLGDAIRAKQIYVQRTLTDLGPEALEERLQSALMSPPASPMGSHALSAAVDACLRERGAPALLVEVDVAGDPAPVVRRATELAEAGADAIVLVAPAVARARKKKKVGGGGGGAAAAGTAAAAAAASPLSQPQREKEDEEADAAATLACLLSVSRSLAANPKFRLGTGDVSNNIAAGSSSASSVPPVLLRDWIVHPLQLADVKAAGGSGALGAAAAVLGKGGPVLTSFGAAMGLDVPLEVVNASESQQATDGGNGVPIVAVNVSLALSISIASIAGAAGAVAEGILGDLPPGCFAVVGCDSLRAVAEAARAGAAAVVVKEEAWHDALRPQGSFQENGVAGAMEELRSAASLSD